MTEAIGYSVGVFGGTFDPIHYGHLRAAVEIQQALHLDQIRFVPVGVAVHRKRPQASAAQRLAMVQAALAGQPGLVADEREILRSGPSYTVDTLLDLHTVLPGATLYLLLGTDAFQRFLSWHKPLDILALAHVVVMWRPGGGQIPTRAMAKLLAERCVTDVSELRHAKSGRVIVQTVTQLDISSTVIRAIIAAGGDIRFLVPDAVLTLIQQQGMYKPDIIGNLGA